MKVITYLSLEQILVIHQDQIDRYGGSHGIRELALLESVIYRPQTTFENEELYPSIFDKAAALIHSIIRNHPFLDGNKRTGITSGIAFLEINGFFLKVTQKQLIETVLKIASKEWNMEQISQWLRTNSH